VHARVSWLDLGACHDVAPVHGVWVSGRQRGVVAGRRRGSPQQLRQGVWVVGELGPGVLGESNAAGPEAGRVVL
jgi:hypothetical protein